MCTVPSSATESTSEEHLIIVHSMNGTDPVSGIRSPMPLETITLPVNLICPGLLVVKMDSSSMEPAIRRNAYVGLDRDDTRLQNGEIYALEIPGEGLVIKRIIRDEATQRLTLLADNPAHQELHLPLDNSGVTTFGKAVWVIQEL